MAEQFIQSITVTFANDQTATVDADGDTVFASEGLFSVSEVDVVQRLALLIVEENAN